MSDKMRVLICNICKTIETLPAYEGDPAKAGDLDFLLHGLLERHGHREMDLGGPQPDMRVADVERNAWADPEMRQQIIKQIREREGHTGLGDDFYDTKDTYVEDAGKCFNRHNRQFPCIDYQDKSKLLGNPLQADEDLRELTRDQRKILSAVRQEVYLCNFCPVQSMVNSKMAGTI